MKKILAILLVVVMSLSMITPVFAGRYTDADDSDYAKAIENLSGLGVINGYEDGSYQPEKIVTRAEMAKLLVVALGLDAGASLLEGETSFDDVDAGHWATGYIAVAVQYGLIKGDGDGNFRPDATVNYAEAATMVLRALGYDRVVDKAGQWPTNYLNKANELKVFEYVEAFKGTDGATRGTVAQMMWNMLKTPMWEVGSESENDGLTYGKGNTMLAVKFPDFNTASTTTPVTYKANYIEEKAVEKITVVDSTTVDVTFDTIAKEVRFENISPLEFVLGAKYDVLYTVEKIDGVEKEIGKSLYKDSTYVVFGLITEATADKVTINGTKYEEATDILSATDEGKMVKLTLNANGKVTAITPFVSTNEIVIDKITTNKDETKTTFDIFTASDNSKIVLDNTQKDVMFVTYDASGTSKTINRSDIKVGMVIEKYSSNGSITGLTGANEKGDIYVVTDKEISGTISKISGTTLGSGAATDVIATIDGTEYRFEKDALLLLSSKTNPEDLTVDLANGLIGETITAKLDASGEIVYIEAEDSVSANNYGFIVKAWTTNNEGAITYMVRVMDLSGATKDYETYDFMAKKSVELSWIDTYDTGSTKDHFLDGTNATEKLGIGVFVEYELEDGKIAQKTSRNDPGKANTVLEAKAVTKINETAQTFTYDSKTIAWNSNTKGYQYEITEADYKVDAKTFNIEDLANGSNYIVIYNATTNVADYILYKGAVSTDKVYGVITDVSYISGKDANNNTLYGVSIYDIATGTEKDLVVGTVANVKAKGAVVDYALGTDGYYDLTDTAGTVVKSGFANATDIYDVGNNKAISLAGPATMLLTGNVEVIFIDSNKDIDETKDLSDVTADDKVYGVSYIEQVNSADDKVYNVIVIEQL